MKYSRKINNYLYKLVIVLFVVTNPSVESTFTKTFLAIQKPLNAKSIDWTLIYETKPDNNTSHSLEESVWRVKDRAGYASAFMIHPSGYLLTNSHVVSDYIDDNSRIISSEYLGQNHYVDVISNNYCGDLALLKVTGDIHMPFPFLNISNHPTNPHVKQKITIAGYIDGKFKTKSGMTSKDPTKAINIKYGLKKWWYVNAYLGPGSSGGPMLNPHGEVIGVIAIGNSYTNKQLGPTIYDSIDDINLMLTQNEVNFHGIQLLKHNKSEIKSISPNSFAQNIGLKEGDTFQKINNKEFKELTHVGQLCNSMRSNEPKFEVLRNDKLVSLPK